MRRKQCRRFVACLLTVTMLLTPILSFNTLAAEIGSIATHMTYRLKNVGSGKYLTVHNGADAETTNIYQSGKSDNANQAQGFRFAYHSTGGYRLNAVCSLGGNNRCATVVPRNGTNNIQLGVFADEEMQCYLVDDVGSQTIVLRSYGSPEKVITANGNSNGSGSGVSATSAGNVYLDNYTGSNYQKWILESYGTAQTVLQGQYYIKSSYSNLYLTVSGYNVVQASKTESQAQMWNVIFLDDGSYWLEPLSNPNYALEAADGDNFDGANVGVYHQLLEDWQRFHIVEAGNNTYRIAPLNGTNRVLDVCGPSTAQNANIQLWEYEDVPQQKWVFELISITDSYSTFGFSWVFPNDTYTYISSGYKTDSRPDHKGIDIWASDIEGEQIIAPIRGVVENIFTHNGTGYTLVLRTYFYDAASSDYIRVGFQHMITGSSPLSKGHVVERGDVIGLVGGSGEDENGDPYTPHLHLGVWNGKNGYGSYDFAGADTARNPLRFFPRVPFTGDRSRTYP